MSDCTAGAEAGGAAGEDTDGFTLLGVDSDGLSLTGLGTVDHLDAAHLLNSDYEKSAGAGGRSSAAAEGPGGDGVSFGGHIGKAGTSDSDHVASIATGGAKRGQGLTDIARHLIGCLLTQ